MIQIDGYQFEGPYRESSTNFNEVAAIYVILDINSNKIDVGETEQLKSRLDNHERRNCWERNSGGDIYIAVYRESSEKERLRIEKEIRSFYNFPCGEE
ncbi:hypothetical protein AMJ49_06620 [Parcubacteria bacterium DG_74_2]|nr:MAG: hypothetical protein AMJ49_06620 [Parcubacteria bacterium DG_74_2]